MKTITQQRIMLVIFCSLVFSSMISQAFSATTLTITPSSGPIDTIITMNGNHFTSSNTTKQTTADYGGTFAPFGKVHIENLFTLPATASMNKIAFNIADSNYGNRLFTSANYGGALIPYGNLEAESLFTASSPNSTVTKMAINITSTGLGSATSNSFAYTSTISPFGTLQIENILTPIKSPNTTIDKVALEIANTGGGGNIRIKIYSSDGLTLIGETGNIAVSSTGYQNFTITPTVNWNNSPGTPNIAVETDTAGLTLAGSGNGGTSRCTLAHTYGTGPSNLNGYTCGLANFRMGITYTANNSDLRFKLYNSTGILLSETNSLPVSSTGWQNFTLPTTTMNGGTIYTALEADNSGLTIAGSGGGGTSRCAVAHTYGTGPSSFSCGAALSNYMEQVSYTNSFSDIRLKVYTTGGTLIGESGVMPVTTNGKQNFTLPTPIIHTGNIYTGLETDNSGLTIAGSGGGGTSRCFLAHTFGPGPNDFSGDTCNQSNFWSQISYVFTNAVNFTYDGVQRTTVPPSPIGTNTTGGFTGIILFAPSSVKGSHTIRATDSAGLTDSKTFTITTPAVTNTISGSNIFNTASITPTINFTFAPSEIFATQNQLYRNGSLVVTNSINPNETVNNGVHTAIQNIGEVMPYTSSYQVNTTFTDGVNQFSQLSNSIILKISSSSPTNGKVCSIDSCPSQTLVNYTVHRTPDFKTLIMTVNLQPIPFHTECNILNGTFAAHNKWFNYTNVSAVNFTMHVPYSDNVYYACYGSGPILSGMSPGNGTLPVQGANVFNQTFGITLGAPIGVFFIAMLASLGNQRTGPIYVVVTLAAIGIMSALLFFTVSSGAWALVLITGFLGIFVGRKIF